MTDIIYMPKQARKNYVFKNRPVQVSTNEGSKMAFPCLTLYHASTGIPVACPVFERWYLKLAEAEQQRNSTLYRKANNMRSFLNFILWETNCDSIHDLSVNDIRDFLVSFKYTDDDEPRDPLEWSRGIAEVYDFLNSYYIHNQHLPFKYHPANLITTESVKREGSRHSLICRNYNKFGIKPIPKTEKRNRLIPYDYLEMLIQDCLDYDPMIAFGVACQAYAGLREGEVVNLTRDSIRIEYGGFGRISKITLDLTKDADFSQNYEGSSSFGHIKKLRKQDVFIDFISDFLRLYGKHEKLIEGSKSNALFLNQYGRPMSVTSYTGRLRKLFNEHFLPDLKRISDTENWAKNAPYIESYEKEYPGAHALRHWFTMYLLEQAKLELYEVSMWRGDDDPTSLQDYVHVNAKMIDIYSESLIQFQNKIIGASNGRL